MTLSQFCAVLCLLFIVRTLFLFFLFPTDGFEKAYPYLRDMSLNGISAVLLFILFLIAKVD